MAAFAEAENLCLLESASTDHPLGRFSYLTADPVRQIAAMATDWPDVRARVRETLRAPEESASSLPPFRGGWIGWFGYELAAAFDTITPHPTRTTTVPDVALSLFDWVIAWDHDRGERWLISTGMDGDGLATRERAEARAAQVLSRWDALGRAVSTPDRDTPRCESHAQLSRAEYEHRVERVIRYVFAGDIFQANLAQRFRAPRPADSVATYRRLTERTAAPMSAYIRFGEHAVLSASPERFLRLDARTRQVTTDPIKGTRPRDADPVRDTALAAALRESAKDRAENLMIVDLMRNDLSRVCLPGTVRATSLCRLESHQAVHHLVSTVVGTLAPGLDALDLLAATFPAGSITGAPKLRAMEIIAELEPVARGVYSGAIGWIGLDGGMETNIAIRTITCTGNAAEFHAGGGITARSIPSDEYDESMDKARALIATLANSA